MTMSALDEMYRAFLKREVQYRSTTDEIWNTVPFVVEGISGYLGVPATQIAWNSIDVIGQELVVLASVRNTDAHVYAPPGAIATRVLTIIIPISVVSTESGSDIQEYLKETQDVRTHDTHPELERGGVIMAQDSIRRNIH